MSRRALFSREGKKAWPRTFACSMFIPVYFCGVLIMLHGSRRHRRSWHRVPGVLMGDYEITYDRSSVYVSSPIWGRAVAKIPRLLWAEVTSAILAPLTWRDLLVQFRKHSAEKDGASKDQPKRDQIAKKYPCVWGYLTADKDEEGNDRKRASLILFTEGSVWKCCVSNKDSDESAFFTGSSPESLLDAVEEGLATGRADWRKNRFKAK